MNSPRRGFTARKRFWVAIFALVSLVIMAGGLAYYRYEEDRIRREKYQELAAIADLKVRQIMQWRRERLDDARSLARDPFLGKAIAAWLRDPGNPGLQAALLERFKVEEQRGAYVNVLLADANDRILLSVRPDPAPLSPAEKQTIEGAVAGRQAALGDLFRCPTDDRVHLDVAAPVLDNQGRPLAVVVLRVNVDKVLYPLIQSWPTPSRTAETLLVKVEGKDVLFLNKLRHREKTVLSLRKPLSQTELPAVQAALGQTGMFEGRDYRDQEVLADLRPVPQSPWFMVAQVDADEILAKARYHSGITGLFVVIFILLTGAVTAYGYRQRQAANLYQDLYRTERERRQAQEEFRTILYSIGDAVITTDTEGRVKQMNQEAERLTGWLEAEAQGRPNEEVFHILNEETRATVENPVERVLREGQVVGLANHTLLIARDGAEHPIADSGAPIRDESGSVMGVVLVFRDQTQEREAQRALAEEAIRRRILVDQSRDGIVVLDQTGKVFEANQRYAEMLGYSAEEVRELYVWDWDAQWTREELLEQLRLVDDAGDHFETRHRRKDGTFVDMEISTNGAVLGERKLIFCVCRDISQRKAAERALRKSEEKFRLVFEKAPLGIMHYDQTSTITDCNEKFAEIIGAPKEKFIGFNMMRQLRDDKMREAVAASLKGEVGYYEGDYLSVTAGKLTTVRAIYQPIFSSDDVLSGGVTLFEDISERKRAELERLQFSKLESLGTLAGGIAHDFNNILTAILGNIGLAALDSKIGPRVKDRLAQAEAACWRAQALSQQLLTFAKGGAPVKKLFSVPELLTETTVFACVGSPVKCETTFPENLWWIEADPGQIGQVFQNLTINAIQAMPTGGTIKVWAENLTVGTESGLPLSAGRYIKISVRDQGMGIPAEHLPRIFDPYFTTKQKGSGLGLASAYAIIEKHHGHIAVESKPGVETTFHIYLPAVDQQVTPQPAEDRELLVGTGKILVMDDEDMVREVLGRLLARLGYEAEFAGDGGEAIEMFVKAHGSGQAFAAVILDLTVPGGMGGKETMARLMEIDPRVKAVVSSGYSDDPIMAGFQKYGFSEVIAKPYRISELGKILHKVIMKKA